MRSKLLGLVIYLATLAAMAIRALYLWERGNLAAVAEIGVLMVAAVVIFVALIVYNLRRRRRELDGTES